MSPCYTYTFTLDWFPQTHSTFTASSVQIYFRFNILSHIMKRERMWLTALLKIIRYLLLPPTKSYCHFRKDSLIWKKINNSDPNQLKVYIRWQVTVIFCFTDCAIRWYQRHIYLGSGANGTLITFVIWSVCQRYYT